MKALIFGANGQDGYYLSELCKLKDIEPIGVSRKGDWLHSNVTRYEQVEGLIQKYNPAYVFHMAANSTTGHDALFENHATISTGALNILEAVRRHNCHARVFITGSGVQFKNHGEPISEDDEFEAKSAYSVARIQSVYAARYFRSLGVRTYIGYLFHHESPLRKPSHVSMKIVTAAKEIARGSKKVIELGNIDVEKEWTFAGDVAKAIFSLVDQEDVSEAVIGSGKTHSIRDWLAECFGLVGKDWQDHVILSEGYTPEYQRLVSNPSTIHSLGWSPEVTFSQLARIMTPSMTA